MNIKVEERNKELPYIRDLKVGTFFMWNSFIYIKISDTDRTHNLNTDLRNRLLKYYSTVALATTGNVVEFGYNEKATTVYEDKVILK